MNDIKLNIKIYVYIALLALAIAFLIISFKVLLLESQQETYKYIENQRVYRNNKIQTQSGNIYAIDATTGDLLLLASDEARYNIYLDLGQGIISAQGEKKVIDWVIKDSVYKNNLNDFCNYLSSHFNTKTAKQWKEYITKNRKPSKRYVPLLRLITQSDWDSLKVQRFCKSGIMADMKFKRVYPYGDLARRTIGIELRDDKGNIKFNGIDGAYYQTIKGETVTRREFKVGKSLWLPVEDSLNIKPKRGKDIISTIDVSLQELAQEALRKCLDSNSAQEGTVILMETATGYIKAIASYTRKGEHQYYEDRNIAVGSIFEPGSTFKTITAMMMLDKGYADTADQVPTGLKVYPLATKPIKDVNKKGYAGDVSFARAMEISSNVGISAEAFNHYGQNNKSREQFAKDLQQYFFYKRLNSDIEVYEPTPYILSSKRMDDMLRMSFGYVTAMTPLQMLIFYNGIANGGKIMKPLFVKAVMKDGNIIETKQPVVLKEKMCKPETLKKIQTILRDVVLHGTGRRLKSASYGIAGKSGTAEINYSTGKVESKYRKHRASFAGYFPANNPQYSCIVVISEPKKGLTHGGDLAAPVFRELSDRVMGVNAQDTKVVAKGGNKNEETKQPKYQYQNMKAKIDYAFKQNLVPDVRGWNISDAVYLFEKLGMKVSFKGYGTVVSQSITPRTKITKGSKIELSLKHS